MSKPRPARIIELQSRTIAALLAGREDIARQSAEILALLEGAAAGLPGRQSADAVLAWLRPHAHAAPTPPLPASPGETPATGHAIR